MNQELIRTKAEFPGMCCICGRSIYVGEKIYRGTSHGNPVASHDDCSILNPDEALRIFDHDPATGAAAP